MKMKRELVPLPVTDVERAKSFYVDRLGFIEDVDVQPSPGVRVVQPRTGRDGSRSSVLRGALLQDLPLGDPTVCTQGNHVTHLVFPVTGPGNPETGRRSSS